MRKVSKRRDDKRRNTRNGLSSTTNASSREEDNLLCRARELHIELFPEEYDHIYDSILEAAERRRGVNPMSAKYIAATNGRREQMGLEPFDVCPEEANPDTFVWLLEKLRAGDEGSLRSITVNRDKEDTTAAAAREAERLTLLPSDWQDQQIDEMLASDTYLGRDDDRNAPKMVAFRVLGELFKINPLGTSEAAFQSQIRRVLPGKTDAEYMKLYRHALNEWLEAYSY